MKKFIIALTALTLATGAANAAANSRNERPDTMTSATAVETMQVRADSVMTSAELARASMNGDEMVTITAFPTNTKVANNNQDR